MLRIKQMTQLMHIPLIHDTFTIHLDKMAMDFGRANVFHVKKLNHGMHLTVGGISD
jgi:hypothetical protein